MLNTLSLELIKQQRARAQREVIVTESAMFGMFVLLAMWRGCFRQQ